MPSLLQRPLLCENPLFACKPHIRNTFCVSLEAIESDAMTAEDVRGVFAKAFELGEWGYDKTVPLEEVRQNHTIGKP